MAQNPDCAASCSSLTCAENTKICFNDFDCSGIDESVAISPSWHHHQGNHNLNKNSLLNDHVSKSPMVFVARSEEIIKEMVEREKECLPRDDYLKRLRSGDLDLSVRREALCWVWKAQAHCDFGPLCICLSVNYLDRFLSVYQLPEGKAWSVQLLAVACLSLAAKMEEIEVPLLVDLQVGEPKYVFEAKTIQRMELMVLSTLKWRMLAFTPCSFIDYFLGKINDDQHLSTYSISRSVQLILNTIKGIDFLEFRPSEIAAAVAISFSREVQAIDIDQAMPCFMHVEKVKGKIENTGGSHRNESLGRDKFTFAHEDLGFEPFTNLIVWRNERSFFFLLSVMGILQGRVLKCIELIKHLSLVSGSATANVATASALSVPQSPSGVLDSACLSYKSDDVTVGSFANSSHSSQDIKKRKQDDEPFQVEHGS